MADDPQGGNGTPAGPERDPTSTPDPISNDNGEGRAAGRGGPVCGAKTRAGTPCQARPCPNGRCRVHGGLSLAGVASPSYKHGKRSRYMRDLPRELRAGYRAALQDEELASL